MTHICLMVSQRLRRRFGASSLCWKRHENKQFVWFCSLPVHYYKCCIIIIIVTIIIAIVSAINEKPASAMATVSRNKQHRVTVIGILYCI